MSVLQRIRAYADPALCIHLPAAVAEPTAGGLHFAVKDNIDVAGMPTTAGCPSFAYQPTVDAAVVARLRAAGHVPVAKTNLDQFATGLVGTRSPYGTPRNRFDPLRIPGGSSSGSACAVAAGLVPFALGTDTAGSGRVPAALQNLVGLKPTRGWLSTRGVVPAVRSLDCVSVFTKSVALAWNVTCTAAGFDEQDAFSRQRPDLMLPSGAVRIGVPAAEHLDGIVQVDLLRTYRDTLDKLRGLGHTLVGIDYAPFLAAARLLYGGTHGGAWVAERTAAVGDFLDRLPPDADPVVAATIRSGRQLDAVAAWAGTYRLAELTRRAQREWQRMDVLVLPTVCEYPTLAEVAADPLGVNSRLGRFTNFANLLDTCALAVPADLIGPLPSGITLFGPAWHDGLLARIGAEFLGEPSLTIDDGGITVAVFGAHLRGQPRNSQLVELGGCFIAECRTAPVYRLRHIRGRVDRPGLVRVDTDGAAIAGELWRLPAAGFGRLVALVTAPLAIGSVTLANGSDVQGFVCEGYAGGEDITAYGSWCGFLAR